MPSYHALSAPGERISTLLILSEDRPGFRTIAPAFNLIERGEDSGASVSRMTRARHEFRDPIHTFIGVTDDERLMVDSAPVQRLRHIHQLALSSLVYPGATHRRFEHALGVMELSSRVFDVVTDPTNMRVSPDVFRDRMEDEDTRRGWRRTIRAAALCHDVGHLPFSHAAETDLLPDGWGHEKLTVGLIRSEQMEELWQDKLETGLRSKEIAKLAVGQKHFDEALDIRESLLSEIITGDAFGVDRIDYLLRDSLHAGVAYGHFDHYRLIDTLRVLPKPAENDGSTSDEPQLGVEIGGLQSAEALLMARYFMYAQVYFHRVRRIFDIHLADFLKAYLQDRTGVAHFPTEPEQHLMWTDAEITAALLGAARDPGAPGHDAARRIVARDPYKPLWEWNPSDVRRNPNAGKVIAEAAAEEFGEGAIRRDAYSPSSPFIDFPVLLRGGDVVSARSISSVLSSIPPATFDYVFVRPDLLGNARQWLKGNQEDLLERAPAETEVEE